MMGTKCSSHLVWRLYGSPCGPRMCSRSDRYPLNPRRSSWVTALDLSLMVSALTVGGVLIWRRMPWGLVISAIASIQGALYLLVLSVNSVVAINDPDENDRPGRQSTGARAMR